MKMEHAYGDGSVYQTADGRWIAKVYLGKTPDGKPLAKRFSAKTKAAVEKKLRDLKKAQRQEAKPETIHYTLAAYFDYWLKTYQYQKLKPLSYDCLESTIRNHVLPQLGKMRFDQVSRDDVQRLINYLYRSKKLSYSSVKKVYGLIF